MYKSQKHRWKQHNQLKDLLESAHHQHKKNMALIGYSGLGLAGYGWAGLGGLVAPLAIHRDGPFLCGNGEHLINGLCKKKRSAEADSEADAYYGYGGYGLGYGLGYGGYGYGGLGYGYGK